nr:conserved hypothetical protein [uncultured bacterium]
MAVWNRSVVCRGERFGRLVVIGEAPAVSGRRQLHVRCACGTEKSVRLGHLRHGKIVSCGCWHGGDIGERSIKHGRTESAEYRTWLNIRNRCTKPRHHNFAYYGGRGITVCPEWLVSFTRFLDDVGPRPSRHHSIDRKNNDGPYAPDNVRWATKSEQALNRRPKGTCGVPAG